MPLRHALEIAEFWQSVPPENEMLVLLAQVFTNWRPAGKPMTKEEHEAAHQKSLEDRWKAGAMNAAQILAAFGGGTGVAVRMDGTLAPAQRITDFPGSPPSPGA